MLVVIQTYSFSKKKSNEIDVFVMKFMNRNGYMTIDKKMYLQKWAI
jgi:hypothetical protein